MNKNKVHYLPTAFQSASKTFCFQPIKHGTAYSPSWIFVTCKKCLKQKVQSDEFACAMYKTNGIKKFVIIDTEKKRQQA